MGTEFLSRTVRIALAVTVFSTFFYNIQAQEHPENRRGIPGEPDEIFEYAPQYNPPSTSLAATLPEAVDNSAGLPPIADRGESLDDGEGMWNSSHASLGWAIAYYVKTYQEGKERGWDVTLPEHQFSPAFIYNHRINDITYARNQIKYALDFIKTHGCATLAQMPMDEWGKTSFPSAEVYKSAIEYKLSSYAKINNHQLYIDDDIETMKGLLASDEIFPMIIEFGNWQRIDGVYTWDLDSLDSVINGDVNTRMYRRNEAVAVVGYDDTKGGVGAFKIVNSMGTGWGDNGFAWISYDYLRNEGSLFSTVESYVMVDRTDYTPRAYARVTLDHPHCGDLFCSIYAYDVSEKTGSNHFFNYHGGDNPGFDMYVDLSDLASFMPPDDNHKFFLNVVDIDEDGNPPVINEFSIEYDGSVYNFTQAGHQGLDCGLTQVSMEGASVPGFSLIGGIMGGVLPRAYSPYLACENVCASDRYDELQPGAWVTLPIGGRSIPSFTIEPGTVIEFSELTRLLISASDVSIRGTETDTIHLRNHKDLPKPAQDYDDSGSGQCCDNNCWFGVWLSGRNAVVEFCSIREAECGLNLSISDGDTVVVKNNLITNMDEIGMSISGGRSEYNNYAVIADNRVDSIGGKGMRLYKVNNNIMIMNNVITNSHNGGISLWESSPVIANNTIAYHHDYVDKPTNDASGAGVFLEESSAPILKNNIIAHNEIGILNQTTGITLAYNNVWSNGKDYVGMSAGEADLSVNPQFVAPGSGDFHLVPFSPAIDAGDPESDFSKEPHPNGGRINLGAYGNTSQATKTTAVFLSSSGSIRTEDTTGTYQLWVETNSELSPPPFVFAIVSDDGGASFGDTLLCARTEGKYTAEIPARSLGTKLDYYFLAYVKGLQFYLPSSVPEQCYTVSVTAHQPGDMDGDDEVDTSDLLEVLKVLTGDDTDQGRLEQADVNGDGKTNIMDVMKLLLMLRSK
ncbi:right-handed parallel beta-helix repeat-containing protein [Gemmatimonadota bacterium]